MTSDPCTRPSAGSKVYACVCMHARARLCVRECYTKCNVRASVLSVAIAEQLCKVTELQ